MLDKKSNDNSIIKNVVENSFKNNGSSKASNASSSYTSLFTSTKRCYRDQENFYQVGVKAKGLMTIKKQ
jgi:hypothetical protein